MMWKKALPLVVLSGVLLVGCNNNTLPKNNETPMEDIRDDARQWKNDVERDVEGRNFDDGNRDNTGANQNGNNINDVELNRDGENTQVEIIEDVNRRNGVQ